MTAGKPVVIYTDGACSGNPGPGGWGAILTWGDKCKELSGGEATTTNNRMELMAAISALEALTRPSRVELGLIGDDLQEPKLAMDRPRRTGGRGGSRPRF